MAKKYDESAVQSLDALAHIRLRSGMYIGRLGDGSHPDDGIYVMLKEVIDNCVDEFIMGEGKRIEITLEGETVTVRDFGSRSIWVSCLREIWLSVLSAMPLKEWRTPRARSLGVVLTMCWTSSMVLGWWRLLVWKV